MLDPRLAGKVVLVTGANNPYGIGAGVARAFACQDAKVFLHYFTESAEPVEAAEPSGFGLAFYHRQLAKSIDEVLEQVRQCGVAASAMRADLADAAAVRDVFDEAERSLGPVEVLVNNAAHWEGDTFLPAGEDLANTLDELWAGRPQAIGCGSFDHLFAVNTRAPALMMAEFARRHIARAARWGRIINVSTAGAHCFPSEISYGASKYALESYGRSAAIELGRFGVTVNTVSLGPVQTGWITPELEQAVTASIPLGRIGTPDDVADVIVFLASFQARWITGQRIFVGGGREV